MESWCQTGKPVEGFSPQTVISQDTQGGELGCWVGESVLICRSAVCVGSGLFWMSLCMLRFHCSWVCVWTLSSSSKLCCPLGTLSYIRKIKKIHGWHWTEGTLHLNKCPFLPALCILANWPIIYHSHALKMCLFTATVAAMYYSYYMLPDGTYCLAPPPPGVDVATYYSTLPAGVAVSSSTGVTATAPPPPGTTPPPPPATAETSSGATSTTITTRYALLLAVWGTRALGLGFFLVWVTQRVSVIWVFIIQVPALQGWSWHRHLEQWDLTNWENSLPVSIPHPSPEPQHLFFPVCHHLRWTVPGIVSMESSYLPKTRIS